MQTTRRQLTLGVAIGAGLTAVGARASGKFPDRPIRMILPFSAGGGTDESARSYADELQKLLSVPVVADNRPGASGLIAVSALMSAPADGYTVLVATNSLVAVNPVMRKDLPYDPFKDLVPVHGLIKSAPVITAPVGASSMPLRETLLRAKVSGKSLSIGNYSEGYQLLAACTLELITAGKIKGVATGGSEREPKLPGVPTMKELGYPDFESYVWSSIFVRSGTPDAVVQTLADAFAKVLRAPAVMARHEGRPGIALALARSELGGFQRREYERFKRVADAAGMVPQ